MNNYSIVLFLCLIFLSIVQSFDMIDYDQILYHRIAKDKEIQKNKRRILNEEVNIDVWYPLRENALEMRSQLYHGQTFGELQKTSDRFIRTANALQFDGDINNYIELPSQLLEQKKEFSLNVWFKKNDSPTTNDAILSCSKESEVLSERLDLLISLTQVKIGSNSAMDTSNIIANQIVIGQWHLISLTVSSQEWRLYLDGNLAHQQLQQQQLIKWNRVVLGQQINAANNQFESAKSFKGALSDLNIISSSLPVLNPLFNKKMFMLEREVEVCQAWSADKNTCYFKTCYQDRVLVNNQCTCPKGKIDPGISTLPCQSENNILSNNLHSYYTFSNIILDLIGILLNGIKSSQVQNGENRFQQPDSAFLFDNKDAIFSYPSSLLQGLTQVTISMWVCMTKFSKDSFLFRGHNGLKHILSLSLEKAYINGVEFNILYSLGYQILPLNEWKQVIYAVKQNLMQIYVNGAIVFQSSAIPAYTNFGIGLKKYTISSDISDQEAFKGLISDVRIFSTFIDQTRAFTIFQAELYICTDPKCIVCLRFQIDKCAQCTLNYVPNQEGKCILKSIFSTCSQTGFKVVFQSLDELRLVFYSKLDIQPQMQIASYDNCDKVLTYESLDKMGRLPQCKLDDYGVQSFFSIKLGYSASYLPADPIYVKSNVLKKQGCTPPTDFLTTVSALEYEQFNHTALAQNPQCTLIGKTEFSYCENIEFRMGNFLNTGSRDLLNIKWQIKSIDAPTEYIQNLNLNEISKYTNLQNIKIESQILNPKYKYQISVSFDSYLGLSGQQSIDFIIKEVNVSKIQFLENISVLEISNWETTLIDFQVLFLQCQDKATVQIPTYSNINYSVEQMTNDQYTNVEKVLLNGITNHNSDGKLQYIIKPYSFIPNQTIFLKFSSYPNNSPSQKSQIFLQIIVKFSKFVHYIEGGSRVQAYSQPMKIIGEFKDINIDLPLQKLGFQYEWKCKDLLLLQNCKNFKNEEIVLNQNSQIQQFQPRYFEPFKTLEIQFNIQKNGIKQEEKVTIVIIDTDIPQINVKVPDFIRTQKVNINSNINLTVDYAKNSDLYTCSLIILYKQEKVAIKQFQYNQFDIRISDILTKFDNSYPNVIIQFSLYDPSYFMPATSTISLEINYGPTQGGLIITPSLSGKSISTQYQLKAMGFIDSDGPISYQFIYYISYEQYQSDLISGSIDISASRNYLTEFSHKDEIQTILPHSHHNSQLLLMVIAKDSLGAVQNKTQTIQIQSNYQDPQAFIENLSNSFDNYQKLELGEEQKVSYYCILVQEIYQAFISKILVYNSGTNNKQFENLYQKLFSKMNQLNNIVVSQYMQQQIQKSLNILAEIQNSIIKNQNLQQPDLITQMVIENMFQNLDKQILSLNKDLQPIIDQKLLYSGDIYIQKKLQLVQDMSAKSLIGYDKILQLQNQTISKQQNEKYFEDFKKINKQIQQVGKIFNSIYQPNSEPISYKGQSFTTSIQQQTNKLLTNVLTSPHANQNLFIENSNEQSIYYTQHTVYKQNPYKYQESFPYQDQDSEVQILDITIKNEDNKQVTLSKQSYTNLKFEIPDLHKKGQNKRFLENQQFTENAFNKTVCIQEDGNKKWNTDECLTHRVPDQSIYCKCTSINPVTIVTDIKSIYLKSKQDIDNLFSQDSALELTNFKFQKSVIFYTYVFLVFFEVYLIIYGYKKDKKEKMQIIDINNIKEKHLKEQVFLAPQSEKQSENDIPSISDRIQQVNLDQNNSKNAIKSPQQQQQIWKDRVILDQNESFATKKSKRKRFNTKYIAQSAKDIFEYSPRNKIEKISNNPSIKLKSDEAPNSVDKKLKQKFDFSNSQKPTYSSESLQECDLQIKQPSDEFDEQIYKNNNKQKKNFLSIFMSFLFFHEFFQIYFVSYKNLSRPTRYLIYFLKIILGISLLSLFKFVNNIGYKIALGVAVFTFTSLPIKVLELILSRQYLLLKITGITIYICLMGSSIYVGLTQAAKMGVNQSNEWAISYITGYVIDFWSTQSITSMLKNKILIKFGKENKIVNIVLAKELIQYYEQQTQ